MWSGLVYITKQNPIHQVTDSEIVACGFLYRGHIRWPHNCQMVNQIMKASTLIICNSALMWGSADELHSIQHQ
jgi:hypothetical protein